MRIDTVLEGTAGIQLSADLQSVVPMNQGSGPRRKKWFAVSSWLYSPKFHDPIKFVRGLEKLRLLSL